MGLVAVSQDGHALRYASAELKADREVVTAAVTQDKLALQYASPELQENLQIQAACRR